MKRSNNKLIAEFIGWEKSVINGITYYTNTQDFHGVVYREEHLSFHKNYNWIMPVLEKITGIPGIICQLEYGISVSPYFEIKAQTNDDDKTSQKRFNFLDGEKPSLELLFNGVVEFIEWYNKIQQSNATN